MGYYSKIALTTPLEAELRSLRYGLKLAVQHNITRLEIESDALDALDCILTGKSIYANLIFECRYWLSRLTERVLRHAFREQNQLADRMAKEGASQGRLGDVRVFVTPPEFAQDLLLADSQETLYRRKIISTNSYAGRDVAYGYFKSILYNYKDLKLAPLDCQQISLIEAN